MLPLLDPHTSWQSPAVAAADDLLSTACCGISQHSMRSMFLPLSNPVSMLSRQSASNAHQLVQQHVCFALPGAKSHASKLARLPFPATHSVLPAAVAVAASCCADGVHELSRLVSHAAMLQNTCITEGTVRVLLHPNGSLWLQSGASWWKLQEASCPIACVQLMCM